jgi:DNA polymerase-3 subunit delta'
VSGFESFPEQEEATRLLGAALADGPAHAYLLHGPRGVGKTRAALAFATALLHDDQRVGRRSHPDLYVVEPLGDQIRIDEIRELRRDLHMRPFEADRRVYLLLGADRMNEDAADALLKDLEEPPPYAVVILVADELGPLPETIRSRCQLVPFKRLSRRAIRAELAARAPELPEAEAAALARLAGGRLDRLQRLLDEEGAARRQALLEVARAVYSDPDFAPADGAARVLEGVHAAGEAAKARAEEDVAGLDLAARDREQRIRRARFGTEREELLAALEELAAWYRDLVVVGAGADSAAIHSDRLEELRADATRQRAAGAEEAAGLVRDTWRAYEEFNLNPSLALEALLVRVRQALV